MNGPTDIHRTEDEPHDELTELGERMLNFLDEQPDKEGVRAIVLLARDIPDRASSRHGTCLYNYDEDVDAAVDMFAVVQAIFELQGSKLMIVPINEG
jgi:hypothetical protein